MNKWITRILSIIFFIVCMALVITGRGTVGVPHLIRMLIGLAGLLSMLFIYNKRHQ